MFERHFNRQLYFNEQAFTTEKYVIPYIKDCFNLSSNTIVAEIGCGEAGNLKPFLDMGCEVVAIDYDPVRIDYAKTFIQDHPNFNKIEFICADIYKTDPSSLRKFDLIILRDTIEHISNQERFIEFLKKFLAPQGVIFFGFPPWRMPFGGHQQLCRYFFKNIPYIHLLPKSWYFYLLKRSGENPTTLHVLKEIYDTRISIARFHKILKKNHVKILKEDHFLFNPNYEIKFKVKPKKVFRVFQIPFIKDFYTMCLYTVVQAEN